MMIVHRDCPCPWLRLRPASSAGHRARFDRADGHDCPVSSVRSHVDIHGRGLVGRVLRIGRSGELPRRAKRPRFLPLDARVLDPEVGGSDVCPCRPSSPCRGTGAEVEGTDRGIFPFRRRISSSRRAFGSAAPATGVRDPLAGGDAEYFTASVAAAVTARRSSSVAADKAERSPCQQLGLDHGTREDEPPPPAQGNHHTPRTGLDAAETLPAL